MIPRFARRLVVAALCAVALPAGRALADDGPDGGAGSIEKKIKEQLEKIARLMRENEAALLEASRQGGKRPTGPDVKPPDAPPDERTPPPAMEGATPPPAGTHPEGETGARGQEIRKRMEELLKTTHDKGGSIPQEIEELIKMIPRRSSQSQDPSDSDPQKNQEGEARKQTDRRPEGEKDPKDPNKPEDPAKKPYSQDTKPPEGDKGEPPHNDLPPWIVGLPPEQQRKIMNGDTKDVPPEYRGLVERYLKWLNEHSGTK